VGFRWRALHAARKNNVTGFVRNLDDGSVEMEAEGCEEDIDRTVIDIERSRYISICDMDVKSIPLQDYRDFEIL
jgi:acylphosphatase